MHKNILIFCFTFPPVPGVGGRKWAKMAKNFVSAGHTVKVVCADQHFESMSPWTTDIKALNITRYPSNYPEILNSIPKNIWQKIEYRFALLKNKLSYQGNYFDKAQNWKKIVFEECRKWIELHGEEAIIIATGAPFSLLAHLAEAKLEFKKFYFVADIRDPWMSGHYFGFSSLSKKRIKYEMQLLKKVLKHADRVTVPANHMRLSYLKLCPSANVIIEPHCIEKKLIKTTKHVQFNPSSNKVRLVNFGSIMNELDSVFIEICEACKEGELNLDFYTDFKKYEFIFRQGEILGEKVKYYKTLSEEKLWDTIAEYDAALLITPAFAKDQISTKYMELVAQRKPIVLICEAGECSEFVLNNNLGIFIPLNQVKVRLQNLKDELLNLKYNFNFNIEQFTFEKTIEKYFEIK